MIWEYLEPSDERRESEDWYKSDPTAARTRDEDSDYPSQYSKKSRFLLSWSPDSEMHTSIDDSSDKKWKEDDHTPWECHIDIGKSMTLIVRGDIVNLRI